MSAVAVPAETLAAVRRSSSARRTGWRIGRVSTRVVMVALCAFMTCWTLAALTFTVTYPANYEEIAIVNLSPIALALLGPVTVPLVVWLVNRLWPLGKVRTSRLLMWGLPCVALGAATWVLMVAATARWDQGTCVQAANQFVTGNFSLLHNGEYLTYYPHQLGLVLYFEAIRSVVGSGMLEIAIELLNVVYAVASIPVLADIARRSFHSRRATNLTVLLSFFCLPPLLLATFDYGNVAGSFLALVAIRQVIVFLQRRSWRALVVGGLALGLAMCVRANSAIALVALAVTLLIAALRRWRWQNLVAVALLGVLALAPPRLVAWQYALRSHSTVGTGIPSTAWIAMGMQDGPMGPGWYNNYTLNSWGAHGGHAEEVSRQAKDDIAQRAAYFAGHPDQAAAFYAGKFVTQWTDPTFQTVWITHWSPDPASRSEVATTIIHGDLRNPTIGVMDVIQSGYLVLALAGLFRRRRGWTEVQVALPLFVLGGAAFHLLWEAKALYSATYFLAIVPMAAYGADVLLGWWEQRRLGRRRQVAAVAASTDNGSAPAEQASEASSPVRMPQSPDVPDAPAAPHDDEARERTLASSAS